MRVEFIHADCVQGMHTLADAGWRGLIDGIVTSPPYAELRAEDYGTDGIPEDEYGTFTLGWAEAALELAAPSALLALNIGYVFREKRMSWYHGQAVGACIAAGWEPVQELVWHKINANPLLGPLVTNAHEPVYVFAKDASRMWEGGADSLRGEYAASSLARYTRKFETHGGVKGAAPLTDTRDPNPLGPRAQSVRHFPTGSEKGNPHPAPMTLGLAEELVLLTTPGGGWCLDPFGGSGTTAIAGIREGRNTILIDAEKKWIDLARKRIGETV